MWEHQLGFDSRWYLWLLLLLPLLWVFSYTTLAGLGKVRRLMAIAMRTLVFTTLVLALAEVQHLRTSDRMTVIYLLDQSRSIPSAQRHAMLEYVVKEVAQHRRADREDRAGVIVFGRDAVIEIPPFDDDIHTVGRLESTVGLRTDATNLEAALKLAHASFPEDTAKRIVIVSDGNENLGQARALAPHLADDGVGVDVVPVLLDSRAEVIVEKITLPPDIRRGQTIETRVVVFNHSQQVGPEDDGHVRGTLRISRRAGQDESVMSEQLVELKPGKNVFSVQHRIDEPGVYTYSADFTPEVPEDDLMLENNRATAFTHVRGKGRVLLIEDWQNRGEFDYLAQRLRLNDLEVIVQGSDELFTNLAELQAYDSVILANVPRASGDSADDVTSFSDEQIRMLVRNTEQMGSGLVMLGGPNSFGAGGWANTELEQAMPVDFQIKNAKIQAVGALVMIMHASELAQGNYWQKVVAKEALNALGPMDYCGLLQWDNFTGKDGWLWGQSEGGLIRVGSRKNLMLSRLNRMQPGDMPQFDPAMRVSLAAFQKVNASVKHMIIISDGDPSPPSPGLVNQFAQQKIQISTVAIGTHGPAGSSTLRQIATATGGKYYEVRDARALPRIYQKEARKVARPLIKDNINVSPQITSAAHEILQGIDGPLPPITGFVQTTLKESSLVEQALVSPDPPEPKNSTILATWNYGAGRTVAFTSDTGARWANAWTQWADYDKFFSQMIRWSMRPVSETGKFTVATDMKDGNVRVVITALDKNDEFLNFIDMQAVVVDPNLDEPFPLKIQQVAPGRYVGDFPAEKAGSYFVNIIPGQEEDENGKLRNRAPIIAGVTVPYSAEFRERESNLALLNTMAQNSPKGGNPGIVITGSFDQGRLQEMLQYDTFRHDLAKARSRQDVWPLFLVLAACLFLADVFVRRVHMGFEWVRPLLASVRRRLGGTAEAETVDQRLERLRSRKQAIAQHIDERRAATRFEPQADTPGRSLDEVVSDATTAGPVAPSRPAAPPADLAAQQDDTYTSRLLEAKKKAWKDTKDKN
jgi:uncharacterized membrane protein